MFILIFVEILSKLSHSHSRIEKCEGVIHDSSNSQAQKAKYIGELYSSDEPVGDLGLNSFDFFQRDRMQNRKGIIAIDLMRWES
jgi:hypothetical protein